MIKFNFTSIIFSILKGLKNRCRVFAYLNYADHSKTIQRNQIKEAIENGAKCMTVSCPKSLAHFNCYLNEYKVLKDRIKIIGLYQMIASFS